MNALYSQFFYNLFAPEENTGENALNLTQVLLLSWPFVILKFFVEFILTYFFLDQIARGLLFEGDYEGLYSLFSTQSLKLGFFVIFAKSFFTMLFFPLWGFFAYIFWKVILNFYFWALKITDEKDELVDEIVCAGFSGYIFYFIPIIGDFGTSIARLVVLFQALRRRIDISALASFFILLTPPLFFGCFLVILAIMIQFLTIS